MADALDCHGETAAKIGGAARLGAGTGKDPPGLPKIGHGEVAGWTLEKERERQRREGGESEYIMDESTLTIQKPVVGIHKCR